MQTLKVHHDKGSGDLGQLILAELERRGIVLPDSSVAPLAATWETTLLDLGTRGNELIIAPSGCSPDDLSGFLFGLFRPLQVHRPLSKDNDGNFWFSTNSRRGNFYRTANGLTICFMGGGPVLQFVDSGEGFEISIISARAKISSDLTENEKGSEE